MASPEFLEKTRRPNNNNCILSYSTTGGGLSLPTKVRGFGHGFQIVASESHARDTRAFYPKQRAVSQFYLTFDLNGYREFSHLMNFFKSYVETIRAKFDGYTTGRPLMQVTMAVRRFNRAGIPISGMQFGDHVGSMVFNPTVTFESGHDSQDRTILSHGAASYVATTGTENDVKNFFYPFSAASYDTSLRPETRYDFDNPPVSGPNPIGGGNPDLMRPEPGALSGQDAIDAAINAVGRDRGHGI